MNKKQAKARANAKARKVRLLKVEKVAEDAHVLTQETYIEGPMPEWPHQVSEAVEPEKRGWWNFLKSCF